MAAALNYLPFKDDCIEARLVHGWMIAGLGSQDVLWTGVGFSRGRELIGALARSLLAHEKKIAAGQDAGASTNEGDDEEGNEYDDDPLFKDSSLALLPGIFAAMRAAPFASAVIQLVSSLPRKQQESLSHYGW